MTTQPPIRAPRLRTRRIALGEVPARSKSLSEPQSPPRSGEKASPARARRLEAKLASTVDRRLSRALRRRQSVPRQPRRAWPRYRRGSQTPQWRSAPSRSTTEKVATVLANRRHRPLEDRLPERAGRFARPGSAHDYPRPRHPRAHWSVCGRRDNCRLPKVDHDLAVTSGRRGQVDGLRTRVVCPEPPRSSR
jgi:hypothetical protein